MILAALLAAAWMAAAEEPIAVSVSRAGFRPKVVNLRKGEPARLLLQSEDDEHCFAVDAFRIEKRIVPGKTTTLDLVPDRGGSFTFYCCLEPDNEALKGKLLVSE